MKKTGKLFWVFLKIGTFIFGGGYAMIPSIRREVIERNAWMTEEELSDCIAISQSLPGAFAVNTALFVGKKVKGTAGALSACFGTVLPAFLSILIVLLFLEQIRDNVFVQGALTGIKAASVALIGMGAVNMWPSLMKGKLAYAIAIAAFIFIIVFSVHAVLAVLLGAFAGVLNYLWSRRNKKEAGGEV